jgi:hypothetical protein
MGYLSQNGSLDELSMRRAIVYGSVLASFSVERFGVERLIGLTDEEVRARYNEFLEITRFDS